MIRRDVTTAGGERSPPGLRTAAACLLPLALGLAILLRGAPALADKLADIRKSGELVCGLVMEPDDWNTVEHHGDIHEFGAEFCKAVGVAILGENARITFRQYAGEGDALFGLAHGKADLVASVTPAVSAEATQGVRFSPPVFYDAQGFMVSRASGIARPEDLAGKPVCALESREAEDIAGAYFARHDIRVVAFPFSEQGEMDAALVGGRCQAETADLTLLAFSREQFHARTKDFVLLPQTISIDPLALGYAQGDARFGAIVDATVNALIQAEAEGIGRANAETAQDEGFPARKRLLGTDWSVSDALGLDKRWAVRVLTFVGNYGEIYDRTVGAHAPLDLPRGLNALWREGGLLTPAPVR